jgi:hypothetical protein
VFYAALNVLTSDEELGASRLLREASSRLPSIAPGHARQMPTCLFVLRREISMLPRP